MPPVMAHALADEGIDLVSQRKYPEAVEKLTEAINTRGAPLWLLKRSTAYIRSNQPKEALDDAEAALCIAFDRANRDLMIEAQLRRAIALYRLGQYADSDICAFWACQLANGAKATDPDGQQDKTDENGDYTVIRKEVEDTMKNVREEKMGRGFPPDVVSGARAKLLALNGQAMTWRIQALNQMEKLPAGHDGRKVHKTLLKYPKHPRAQEALTATENTEETPEETTEETPEDIKPYAVDDDAWKTFWDRYTTMHAKHKLRCDFYQSGSSMNIDIFVKNLTPDQVSVDFTPEMVTISPVGGASFNGYQGPITLFFMGPIDPTTSTYSVGKMKIELSIKKSSRGPLWPRLRLPKSDMIDNLTTGPGEKLPDPDRFRDLLDELGYKNFEFGNANDPSAWYATVLKQLQFRFMKSIGALASKGQMPDKVEVSNVAGTNTSKSGGSSGGVPQYPTSSKKGPTDWDHIDDGEDDVENSGDVNSLFQKLYKDGDENMKRAMMKSYVESNGTALSTSWDDAKSKTYQTQPPDGVEAKKWK